MLAAWRALRRYWFIPLLAIGSITLWFLLGRWRDPGVTPLTQTQAELDAIAAGAEADRVRVEMGTAEALKHVTEKYADRMAKLDDKQKARATKLIDNPEALARFIVRGTEP